MLIEKVYDELNEQIQDLKKAVAALGSGGTSDYSELTNKPSINGITLSGYKYSDDLKIAKSMTESQYSTAQKYSQTLYCLTENEPESHTQETVPATNFTWTADGDKWVSDEYSIHEENATSITVTTTTEGITLSVTGSGEDRTVILTSSVDPETLTNIVIQIDTVNDVGATRIVKDGVEFGKSTEGGEGGIEVITLTSGTNTSSRTFEFEHTPKYVAGSWNADGTWRFNMGFVWGADREMFTATDQTTASTGVAVGCGSVTYGADGKSMTLTTSNAGGCANSTGVQGKIIAFY